MSSNKIYDVKTLEHKFCDVTVSYGKVTEIQENSGKIERKCVIFNKSSVFDPIDVLGASVPVVFTFDNDMNLNMLIKALMELKKIKLEE